MPSPGNGPTRCDGLSVLAGGKIPPDGTHAFCVSDFLAELIFLALLSKYLAFHLCCKVWWNLRSWERCSVHRLLPPAAVGSPGDPRRGEQRWGARLRAGSREPDRPPLRPTLKSHGSGHAAVPAEAAGALAPSLGLEI